MIRLKLFFTVMVLLLMMQDAISQIPVEVFGGHEKSTLDVLFFKYFKNKKEENSKFLFFNRNRASIDYRQTSTAYQPQFGFTEALSYNHPKLKGFAPVVLAQILNTGLFPKAGIQFVKIKKEFLFFSWAVIELIQNYSIDYYLLTRYTPRLGNQLKLFAQLESVNTFPTEYKDSYSFIQRTRLGLGIQNWQFGLGGDFVESGNDVFTYTQNVGCFLRHEF